jgi:hypothetical protein
MAFIRNKENFTCGHCAKAVVGNGYTNHCPECLWSQHVDKEPGDRAELCQALMEPIAVTITSDTYRITHRCVACGYEKINTTAPEDQFESVLALVRRTNDELTKG